VNQATKVFIVSLDGATFDVIRPLVRQGYMPNLGRALEHGLAAELESVIPPVTASAWTSFMTGKQPSKHGIFDFARFDVETSSWKINNSQHIRAKTLWQILSEKGKRVVVLNLPYTYPPYEVNGVMVSGWDAPTMRAFTYPAELGAKIFEIIPDYGSTLDLSLWNYLPAESNVEFKTFTHKLIRSSEQGAELASHFLSTQPWDVFMVHFQQTDWIQHKLWAYIEKACLDERDKSDRIETVRQCYRKFDELVGRLLASTGSANPVRIILSDHGFGRYRGLICPNYFLNQWGHFYLRTDRESMLKRLVKNSSSAAVRKIYRGLAKAKHSFQGQQAVKKYKSWADMVDEAAPQDRFPVDWRRTKAAALVGSETAFLYVNVEGRNARGMVAPGAEYEALVTDLIERFHNIRDPKSGDKLLTRVARGVETYSSVGDGVLLPDLVLVPADGYVFSTSTADGFVPEVSCEGNHRHNGILLMQGDGVKSEIPDFRPHLVDLAPTILHMLGLAVPADMDGRVLEEAFSDARQVHYEDVDNAMVREAADYTDQEAELIEQRLKGLGYIE
jgi:predicted AlkP superfamily phosphohydrolase/phosphomutase